MFRALVIIGFFPERLNLESVAAAAVMDPMRSTTFDANWRLLDPAKSTGLSGQLYIIGQSVESRCRVRGRFRLA